MCAWVHILYFRVQVDIDPSNAGHLPQYCTTEAYLCVLKSCPLVGLTASFHGLQITTLVYVRSKHFHDFCPAAGLWRIFTGLTPTFRTIGVLCAEVLLLKARGRVFTHFKDIKELVKCSVACLRLFGLPNNLVHRPNPKFPEKHPFCIANVSDPFHWISVLLPWNGKFQLQPRIVSRPKPDQVCHPTQHWTTFPTHPS